MEQLTEILSNISLTKLLPALAALVIGLIAIKLLGKLFEKAIKRTKLDAGVHNVLRMVFKILLYALLVLIVFGTLGFNVSSLVAVLSVVSLAVSLAIQGTLANIAGGIQVLTAHPFRIGDFVEIGEVSGYVKSVHLVYTVLVTMDNKDVFVPNSDVASARIVNFTAEGRRRLDLTFGVSYDSDADTVRQALLECVQDEAVLEDPAPFVGLLNYGNSAIEFVLRVWCKAEDYWDVYFALQYKAKRVLDAHHIEITYPHLNVHLDK